MGDEIWGRKKMLCIQLSISSVRSFYTLVGVLLELHIDLVFLFSDENENES